MAFKIVALVAALMGWSVYHYGPNEYVTVRDGASPDGRWAVAAHGEGVEGWKNFHLYLMDARRGKRIGPLEEIVDHKDGAPESFRCYWSADSRHVLINYRADTHQSVFRLYRIEHRRAYPVTGPTDLLQLVNPSGRRTGAWKDYHEVVRWLTNRRFELVHCGEITAELKDTFEGIERYADHSAGNNGTKWTVFSVRATAVLDAHDRYHVEDFRPAPERMLRH